LANFGDTQFGGFRFGSRSNYGSNPTLESLKTRMSPASGLFAVTGKYWPTLHNGRFVEAK
jgi:hypothetical protein